METTPPLEGSTTEIQREEPDGIGPEITAALAFSETEWEQWLRECFPTFKGNYQRATVLLRSFVQGMKYVSEGLTEKGLKKKLILLAS